MTLYGINIFVVSIYVVVMRGVQCCALVGLWLETSRASMVPAT